MSQSWTDGYIAEITYTHGFYRELTPAMLRVAALARNQDAPDVASPLTYCELGCGQGFSTNLLAAANPHIRFYATDFNPTQVSGARDLAAAAGIGNVQFFDDSFEEFAQRDDLPSFDFICLHGIYSWISAANRAHIVEFIRRRLKIGGLVYISYNTLPGWASFMPIRRLLVDQASESGGPIVSRIDAALAFTDSLLQVNGRYTASQPGLKERVERLKTQPRAYLAHEYFNKDWTPFYFADVVAELEVAKLNWAASANLLDTQDVLSFSPEQQKFLGTIADPVRRESMRDYLISQQFRRDIFIKGPRTLAGVQQISRWREMRLALTTPAENVSLKVNLTGREVMLQETSYNPVLDILKKGPITVQDLLQYPTIASMNLSRLLQSVVILMGLGHVQPCLPAETDEQRRDATRRFNRAVAERARHSGDLNYLASPVTGGGITVDRIHQLFLLGHWDQAPNLPAFAWDALAAANQRLLKDGAALQTAEENLAELASRHERFLSRDFPIYRGLGIA